MTQTRRDNRISIMIAAEQVFARRGFDGASMRDIARSAEVSQALLHYHFGTKKQLYDDIFVFRATQINDERSRRLDRLLAADTAPSLESIIEALFRPTIEFGHDPAQSDGSFSRILASAALARDAHHRTLIEDHYDGIAVKFIRAFRMIEPDLTEADAVWSYIFAIGVGMTMMAPTGRPARLSGGACDDGDGDALLGKIVTFVKGGLEQLIERHRGQIESASE